jgi:hypothetical protein
MKRLSIILLCFVCSTAYSAPRRVESTYCLALPIASSEQVALETNEKVAQALIDFARQNRIGVDFGLFLALKRKIIF